MRVSFQNTKLLISFKRHIGRNMPLKRAFPCYQKKRDVLTEYFDDYRPLAFFGTTTLHGNNYVSEKAESRLTFLVSSL